MSEINAIDKINQSTDILKLASEFISLEKRGKNYMGLCPFHEEKTPSFSVSPEKNIAYCMGCGEGGAPITFYSKIKNISFKDALYELGRRAGLEHILGSQKVDRHENDYDLMEAASAFYHYNLLNSQAGKKVLDYLKLRNVSFESIKHFEIGLSPKYGDTIYQLLKEKNFPTSKMIELGLVKHSDSGDYYDLFSNRLMFPIKNENGRTIAFSGRTLDKSDNVKYVNSPQTNIFNKGNILYNFNEAKNRLNKEHPLIISEGFFDTIKIYQSGFKHVIATMGTALTNNHISSVKRITNNVITAFDGDNAGLEASFNSAKMFLKQGIVTKIIPFPNKLDPDDYIDEFGDDAFLNLVETKLIDAYTFMYQSVKHKYDFKVNANIPKFKNEAIKLINTFDVSIRPKIYEILAKDLNINIDSLVLPKTNVVDVIPKVSKKKQSKELKTKYENAEMDIILAMIKSKDLAYFIQNRLNDNDYINIDCSQLRKKIINYYDSHATFDTFSEELGLNQYELAYIEKVNLSLNSYYNMVPTKEKVLELIPFVKKGKILRKLEKLEQQIDEALDKSEKIALSLKRDNYKKELDDNK